jgi:hypothetical protein
MRIGALLRRWLADEAEGTEIIEFAVSLPLMVVLVVGIYDFGSAFTVKHKLNDAVREGARVGSSQVHPPNPAANNGCGTPASICVVRDVIASSLSSSLGNDCGLGSTNGNNIPAGTSTWKFTVSSGNCSGLILTVERGVVTPGTITLPDPFDDEDPYQIENTRITLVYPYEWQFNGVFKMLAGNSNYLASTITASSTMQNLD